MLHICQLWIPLLGLCSPGSFQCEHDDAGNDDGATDKCSHVRNFPQHDKTDDGRDQRIDEHVVGHFAGAVCNSDRLAPGQVCQRTWEYTEIDPAQVSRKTGIRHVVDQIRQEYHRLDRPEYSAVGNYFHSCVAHFGELPVEDAVARKYGTAKEHPQDTNVYRKHSIPQQEYRHTAKSTCDRDPADPVDPFVVNSIKPDGGQDRR